MVTNDKVLARIKKLLALADPDANDSQAQIEAALAKVAELLHKHGLAMSDVEAYRAESEIVIRYGSYHRKADHQGTLVGGKHSEWFLSLGEAVAYANYCRGLYSTQSVSFVGRPQDVEMAAYMFDQLFDRLVALSGVAMEGHKNALRLKGFANPYHAWGHEHPRLWRRRWLEGCALGLSLVLCKPRRDHEWKQFRSRNKSANSKALVSLHEDALSAHIERARPNLETIGDDDTEELYGAQSFTEGYEAGSDISVRDGLNTPESRLLTR